MANSGDARRTCPPPGATTRRSNPWRGGSVNDYHLAHAARADLCRRLAGEDPGRARISTTRRAARRARSASRRNSRDPRAAARGAAPRLKFTHRVSHWHQGADRGVPPPRAAPASIPSTVRMGIDGLPRGDGRNPAPQGSVAGAPPARNPRSQAAKVSLCSGRARICSATE